MNLKNKTYMKNEEFKQRQNSFEFFCRAAIEFLIEFKNECRRGWQEIFRKEKSIKKPMQLPLFISLVKNRTGHRSMAMA